MASVSNGQTTTTAPRTPQYKYIRKRKLVGRTVALKEQSAQDEENTAAWLSARQVRERAVAKFLTREGAKARAADDKAKEFIAGFRVSL